jgi:Carboxypeptidase regulatory-like domain
MISLFRNPLHHVHHALGVLVPMLLCREAVGAPVDRAKITGHVTDPTGAVVPGVRIIITQLGTKAAFTGTTNGAGLYSITQLPIGDYTVRMHRDGFPDVESTVHLIASQVQSLDVQLPVGSSNQAVVVSGAPPLLETQTSSVQNTMGKKLFAIYG